MPLSCRARHRETSPYRAQEAGPPSRALAVGPASFLGPKTFSSFSRGGGAGPGRIPTGQLYKCIYIYVYIYLSIYIFVLGGVWGPATKGQTYMYVHIYVYTEPFGSLCPCADKTNSF